MNTKHEQPLIDRFVVALNASEDDDLRIAHPHNDRCGKQNYADLEFTSASGLRWAIEAKTGKSGNRNNEVHKLFGNLLRETGRERGNGNSVRIGLLLDAGSEAFFRKCVRRIDRCKFIWFGLLVPVDSVFVCDDDGSFERKTWADFYDDPGDGRQTAAPPSPPVRAPGRAVRDRAVRG